MRITIDGKPVQAWLVQTARDEADSADSCYLCATRAEARALAKAHVDRYGAGATFAPVRVTVEARQ